VLKTTTRTGSLYWPVSRSAITISRSVRSSSVSDQARPSFPPKSGKPHRTVAPKISNLSGSVALLAGEGETAKNVRGVMKMRKRTSAIISGLGIIAVLLALAPDPVAARRGSGVRGGGSGRAAMATGGHRRAAVGRPGRNAGVRGGGGGWGWNPVAAGVGAAAGIATGVAAGVAAATNPWGGGSCTQWDGFRWVNVCAGPYGYGGRW